MRVRNIWLLALCILLQNIAHAHLAPEVQKDIVVTKEEFLSVRVFDNFADAFADARQWGRDFFIYKDIVYLCIVVGNAIRKYSAFVKLNKT